MILPDLSFAAPPTWLADAICSQTDPAVFYPDKGGSPREAKAVCAGCDVRAQCLEWALASEDRWGIFGGTTDRERRQMRRDRKQAA